jgi:regulator of cell morphogenesis and NO signaling
MYQTTNLYLTPDIKMSEVILNNPYLMLLLEHFNINVPLQEQNIHEVCRENHISTEVFLTFANLYNGVNYLSSIPFSFSETQTIISYLRNSHKYYTYEIYPNIRQIIKQMYEANNHTEMALVEKFFNEYFNEVTEHLDYEDDVVFPYISGLYEHIVNQEPYRKNIHYSVTEYKDHHNDIEEKLADLKNLLVKYLPLKDDLQIRRKLLFNLFELEYDLAIHSKIEDFILIPLVEKMELHLTKQK